MPLHKPWHLGSGSRRIRIILTSIFLYCLATSSRPASDIQDPISNNKVGVGLFVETSHPGYRFPCVCLDYTSHVSSCTWEPQQRRTRACLCLVHSQSKGLSAFVTSHVCSHYCPQAHAQACDMCSPVLCPGTGCLVRETTELQHAGPHHHQGRRCPCSLRAPSTRDWAVQWQTWPAQDVQECF